MRYRSLSLNLPEEIREKMNYTMYMLVDIMAEMTIGINKDGSIYWKKTYFTEDWLAKRLGRTREWVSKSLRRLEKLNILEVIRQRQKDGKYAINAYRFTNYVLSLWGQWRQKIKAKVNSVVSRVNSYFKKVDSPSPSFSSSISREKDLYKEDGLDNKREFSTYKRENDFKSTPKDIDRIMEKIFKKVEDPEEKRKREEERRRMEEEAKRKKEERVRQTLEETVATLGERGIRNLLEIDKKYFDGEVLADLREFLKEKGLSHWIP